MKNQSDLLVVRRKNLDPSSKDFHKWETLLRPGHWIATSYNYIIAAMDQGFHILWNPVNHVTVKANPW